jgi:glycosyltransferase involved in cell wall biosynthesis
MKPRVTVVMPLYNAERYVLESIRSLQAQTFAEWRLIVVDDCSNDRGPEIVAGIRDHRIRLLRHQHNRGAGEARNTALAEVETPYIAFLDADDICLRRRLQRQVAYLDAHPRVGVLGSAVGFIDTSGVRRRIGLWETRWRWWGREDTINITLLFRNPLCNSSVMLRRDAVGHQRFKQEYAPAEDYEFWVRMAQRCDIHILRECHVLYRDHSEGISKMRRDMLQRSVTGIAEAQLRELGVPYSADDVAFHLSLSSQEHPDLPDLPRTVRWFRDIEAAFRAAGLESECVRHALAEQWLHTCTIRAACRGPACIAAWRRMPAEYRAGVNARAVLHMLLKALVLSRAFR